MKVLLTTAWLLGAAWVAAEDLELNLPRCPDTPNCVSSLQTNTSQAVEAFEFAGRQPEAWEDLQSAIGSLKRVSWITVTNDYLHAEVRSALFRFVDDVHCKLDPENRRIDIRSASRAGKSDLGVNRKRVERIRQRFLALQANRD